MFMAKIDRHGVLCFVFCATLLAAAQDVQAQEPTAKVYLTPVASHPDGAYNTGGYYGESDVDGQDVAVTAGGGRVFLELQASDWGPSGSAVRSAQLQFDASSMLGVNAVPPNPGCDLTLTAQPCVQSSDCGLAMGAYSFPRCISSVCEPVWVDGIAPNGRPDWIYANIVGGLQYGVALQDPFGPSWFMTTNVVSESRVDDMGPGYRYNLGVLSLDVPACAGGRYELVLPPFPFTFLGDEQVPSQILPIADYVAATITITNCNTNADCDDFDLCTDDICTATKFCTNPPKSSWNPETQCCNPPTGATALIPFTRLCSDISCSLGGSLGTLVLVQHPEGTICDLNDPCTVDESCNAVGSCVGVEFAGPACQKSRFITLDPADMGGQSAIRVTLTSLHRPDPPYLIPQMGGDFSAFEGEVRWVGPASDCINFLSVGTTYKCASLQCTPFYTDWAIDLGNEFLHVTGAAIVPSSRYDVDQFPDTCTGVEDACASVVSEPVVTTGRWGDIVSPYQLPSPDPLRQPNGFDVVAMIDIVKSLPSNQVSRPRGLLAGDVIDLDRSPNVFEITLVLDGLDRQGYPYAGPSPCGP